MSEGLEKSERWFLQVAGIFIFVVMTSAMVGATCAYVYINYFNPPAFIRKIELPNLLMGLFVLGTCAWAGLEIARDRDLVKASPNGRHSGYCPTRSKTVAFWLLIFFSLAAMVAWKGKDHAPERDLLLIFGLILATVMSVSFIFTGLCKVERFLGAIFAAQFAKGLVSQFVNLRPIREASFVLWILGAGIVLQVLIQSHFSSQPETE